MPMKSLRLHAQRNMQRAAVLAFVAFTLVSCGEHESNGTAPAAPVSARVFEPVDLAYALRVPLTASLRAPSGATVEARSFTRDGHQVIRVTATEPGLWSYTVSAPNKRVAEGRLRAQSARLPGFVRSRGHAFAH